MALGQKSMPCLMLMANPMKFILTGGEKSDYQQALPLLSGASASAVLADKGYDADYIVKEVLKMNAEAVIPPRSTRNTLREYGRFLYKERNIIERMFWKMKHFHSVATRYSKMVVSYLAFIHLAAILLWLK